MDAQNYVQLVRENGSLGPAIATFGASSLTPGPGAAVQGLDYFVPPTTVEWLTEYPGFTWMMSPALSGVNNQSFFTNYPNSISFAEVAPAYLYTFGTDIGNGNLALNLTISQPMDSDVFFLGGENIPLGLALGTAESPVSLVDPYVPYGQLQFSAPVYAVNENGINAVITVSRTGGSGGRVTINYTTTKSGTALPGTTNAVAGTDYTATSGQLVFDTGVTNATFNVGIINGTKFLQDRTVHLQLFGISGGATYGALTNASLRIINDNYAAGQLSFSSTNFGVNETDGFATIGVTRTGGSVGAVSVSYAVTNLTATNGVNFTATTNSLGWASGDTTTKTFRVPVFHDGLVTSNLVVGMRLFNPMVGTSISNALFTSAITGATLTITNQDFFGNPSFSTGFYTVNENGGAATITVVRQGGSAQTMTVGFSTTPGTAIDGLDYHGTNGTLVFGPGVFSQTFTIPIIFRGVQQSPDPYLFLNLQNVTPSSSTNGQFLSAQLRIVNSEDNNEPPGGVDVTFDPNAFFDNTVQTLALQANGQILAGGDFTVANSFARNRIARLNTNGTLDVKFSSAQGGADSSIRTLVCQTDGRILAGGLFQNFNGAAAAFLTRLNYDGSTDSSFSTGSGLDGPVYTVAETFVPGSNGGNPVRKILVGGSFSSINQISTANIARLNNDGSLDYSFSPGTANGTVYAMAVYPASDQLNAGKVLITGDFTTVNNQPRFHVARLNTDGTLDTSFNPGVGPNDSVRAVAIQVDGKIVIGGLFTSVSGATLNHIARLQPSGGVDPTFTPGAGFNDVVSRIVLQEDQRILVAGFFTQENGVTRNRVTRMNSDGTIDPAINFGLGANDFVAAMVVQPDSEIVIGGAFTTFDGLSRPHIARLYGRSATGQGAFTFTAPQYQVAENATNATIGIRRTGGTGSAAYGNVYVTFETSDGTAIAGTDYTGMTNTLTFPVGEVFATVTVPVTNTLIVESNKIANLLLVNPTNTVPGAPQPVLGTQPTAELDILNVNSAVSFSAPTYRVSKSVPNGSAAITVVRNASSIGPASVTFMTTTNGTAQPGLDFTPTTNVVNFADGDTQETVFVQVNNNGLLEGNTTVDMILSSPSNTVLLSPSEATLTIVDNNLAVGNVAFAQPAYIVNEKGTNAVITVIRTNGSVNPISVQYSVGGGTAIPGLDYAAVTNSLAFADGQMTASFLVPVFYDPRVTGDQTVNVTLSNPTGGAGITGPSTVPLTIQDADVGVAFPATNFNYFVSETGGSVTVTVVRVGSPAAAFSVHYATADGTAFAGTNYVSTSGTLNFLSGELLKTFNVPILHDPAVQGNLVFFINLNSPQAPAQLGLPSTATVTVIDVDSGFSFASPTNSVLKTGTNAVIGVLRSGSTVGVATVNVATSDGSARAGVNYRGTNVTLTFLDGQASNSFVVPIIDDHQVDGDLTVNLALSAPTNLASAVLPQLLAPSNAVLTIVDPSTGLNFSSPSYTVNENGHLATITVVRTGILTNTVSVNFATSDGSATAGNQYVATNGVLTFSNGVTSQTFQVPIIDKNITGGSETVFLNLSNSSTNDLVVGSPSTLTILNNDGSVIVTAGAALLQESGPVNGVIDPNETVKVLFAFRNTFGQSTTNLMATLLTTNGITLPSGPQSYGVLVPDGPSVSRAFTFTASGTNGSTINATFRLQDGAAPATTNSFSFVLGLTTNVFAVTNAIVINDDAAASPYPSTNVVSLPGTISKVTVTVSNMAHASWSDVSVLLVGPTGTNVMLMGAVGGHHGATNVTLTFDDSAASGMTTGTPTSGSYQPTQFNTGFSMLPPAPSAQAAPYGTTLSGFVGTVATGNWLLYVLDDLALDAGAISNGWSLGITTLNSVPGAVDLAVGVTATPSPAIVTSNLVYTISVTNFGPSTATGVRVTDILPPGVSFVTASPAGSYTAGGGTVTFNLGSMALGNGTNFAVTNVSLTVNPGSSGTITNTVSVVANEAEQNPDNNTVVLPTVVNDIQADLTVGVTVSPNPVWLGQSATYTVGVTNLGPATASGVVVSNVLPAGLKFVSSSIPTNSAPAGVVAWSIGTMPNGANTNFTFVATTKGGGTITNTLGVGSAVLDPFKGNNQGSAKLTVNVLQVGGLRTGANLKFTYPTNFDLYYATNLNAPITWLKYPVSPTVVGGSNTVTVGTASGTVFFRLKSSP